MAKSAPFVVREDACPVERWDDTARGSTEWRTLISADRTPTEALTFGVAVLPPGAPAGRLHRHAHAEVYYVLEGAGTVQIDGEAHPLRKGTAVFIPGNAEHGSRNTGPSPLRILYAFAADSFDEVEYRFSG